ncbi:hypothetical protein [Roseimicrobium sp. ORNL1]|uniref:FitA-like ribbon-helix-helix domain-containing protein n=1 Tax=Roseimicrobium sp. ORNL1 TaxID=2711231 RepID=UPI0013E1B4A3|nr:hypothetical protein [Roseimicrobium sp. ORNL1]QIF04457.1 hypothetical protein G5S37_24000 [Roseimicrobium sp. ORNL1]
MAQLVVRNLDPALIRRLEERVVVHGVSVEEERRRILQSVLASSESDTRYDILKQVLVDAHGIYDELLFERFKEFPRDSVLE